MRISDRAALARQLFERSDHVIGMGIRGHWLLSIGNVGYSRGDRFAGAMSRLSEFPIIRQASEGTPRSLWLS
jgi:hypothetical protein